MLSSRWGRRDSLLSVVVPAYEVAAYLPTCLDSILAQDLTRQRTTLQVIVVDDGSPDDSGAIADEYAARDARVRVVHTDNRGLGAARNEGLRHATGDFYAFADSDDVVPPGAYAALLRQQHRSGADLVTGSVARWEGTPPDDRLVEPAWMRRLHHQRSSPWIEQQPEILGDVFAWNKVFRALFWDGNQLAWTEGVRYEDQPTTTRAYLAARLISVIPEVVYHWRIRDDGSSITQQRSSLADLRDRWTTKQMALGSVEEYGSPAVTSTFHDKVLAGDLHRYFAEIPGCSDEWWSLLQTGVVDLWGPRHSLTGSGLLPVDRLIGWLVEQDRREDAVRVVEYRRTLGRPVDRVSSNRGRRIDVPVIDQRSVAPAALLLRDHEH